MLVITGNKNKQNEIKNFIETDFLDIDLKEVYANFYDIVIHKIKEALKYTDEKEFMLEDITMYVDNDFFPDIKWKQDDLQEGQYVELILTIGKYNNGIIDLYTKRLKGYIHFGLCDKYDFGFDNIFMVGKYCLGDHKKLKPLRSLYKDILENKVKPEFSIDIKEIPEWSGKFQNQNFYN